MIEHSMNRLKPTAVLRELRMVPAAMVYLGWEVRDNEE